MSRPGAMIGMALVFEAGLGVVAVAVGALVGHSPLVGGLEGAGAAALVGSLAALPLFAILQQVERLPFRWLRELRRLAERMLPTLFAGASDAQLLVVSIAAGAGEELLFRGLIQDGLAAALGRSGPGCALALIVASALFGAAHPLTRGYAAAAAAIGVYLGLLLWLTGSLLAPVAAHALYDFLALRVLLRGSSPSGPTPSEP